MRAELAPMMEIESWIGEDRAATSASTSSSAALFQYALQTTSSTTTSTAAAERTYSAYADEPLTATQDTISSTQAWLQSRRH